MCGKAIADHLCELASESSESRVYAMDTLAMLITSQLSAESVPATAQGPSRMTRLGPGATEFLSIVPNNSHNNNNNNDSNNGNEDGTTTASSKIVVSQSDLLAPLCQTIETTERALVAEAGITALQSILEDSGHTVEGLAWTAVIAAVTSLSGHDNDDTQETRQRHGSDWSSCCMLAFRCLKLIVDDFLDQLPPFSEQSSPRVALLDCCAAFGRSWHDVNTSLTAIGLLWTIADQDQDSSSTIDVSVQPMVVLVEWYRPWQTSLFGVLLCVCVCIVCFHHLGWSHC